jgi:predicted Zn-dependent protease
LRGRRSILREIAIIVAVVAAIGAAAFAFQRLVFPRPAVSAVQPDGTKSLDIAESLDEGLGSLVKSQVLATNRAVDVPRVEEGFAVIVKRLHDSLPESRTVDVIVLRSREINAFALPGGTICVNTGLIRELHSAEEMAGVLGHELSHVVNRDPLTLLSRRLGMAALISVMSGGQGGTILSDAAQTLVDMHYGREAEDRADDFSVKLLARAGIPPDSFGDALQLIRDSDPKEPGLLKYLDPHSPIDERIARARDLARSQACTPRPLGVDWNALVLALPGR